MRWLNNYRGLKNKPYFILSDFELQNYLNVVCNGSAVLPCNEITILPNDIRKLHAKKYLYTRW